MSGTRAKFQPQVNSAEREEPQPQDLAHEALSDLIEKPLQASPRVNVMDAYATSNALFASVYRKLAD